MNPYFVNLIGALIGSQTGPKVNPAFDTAPGYDEKSGMPLDENGKPVARYVEPSIWTRIFNPNVASQITQANTAYQMMPDLAERENMVRMNVTAGNLAKAQPYFSNPNVSGIPVDALARLTGGRMDLGSVYDVAKFASDLDQSLPQKAARQAAAQSQLDTSRLDFLNQNDAGKQFGSEALFGSKLGESGAKAGLQYDVPGWQARASSTGNQLASESNIARLPLVPLETGLRKQQIAAEGNQLGREIASAPYLDTSFGNIAKTGALDSGTNLAVAGTRSTMSDLLAKAAGNQIVSDLWKSGHMQPDTFPRTHVIDGTNIKFGERNPAFVAPIGMQIEAMQGIQNAIPSKGIPTLPNGASIPKKSNAIDVRTGTAPISSVAVPAQSAATAQAANVPSEIDGLVKLAQQSVPSRAAKGTGKLALKYLMQELENYNADLKGTDAMYYGGSIFKTSPSSVFFDAYTKNKNVRGFNKANVEGMFNDLTPEQKQQVMSSVLRKLGIQ